VETENLITEGFSLMLMGMGTVFVFLTILVIVTTFMSSLVQKYLPETHVEALPSTASPSTGRSNQTLLAVISAAIHAHRSKK
tara:strand:+ start:1016 stop:1261 length:246 start_codon:yes stop_codon:yes gene_type:complete